MASIETPAGPAPIIPVIMIGTGFYLCWFGVHYWGSDTKFPTDPVKAVLQGKPLPKPSGQTSAQSIASGIESSALAADSSAPGSTPAAAAATGIAPVATGTALANQTIGKLVTAAYGWAPSQSPAQWNDLVLLWTQESSWDNNAANPGTGAYGIAQALGHGKGSATQGSVTNEYGGYGVSDAMAKAANSGDPASQITWGLQYIKQTYGSPSAAWGHEQSANWY